MEVWAHWAHPTHNSYNIVLTRVLQPSILVLQTWFQIQMWSQQLRAFFAFNGFTWNINSMEVDERIVKHHCVEPIVRREVLDFCISRYFPNSVHRTYIRTEVFGSVRNFARNVGTHFRCKPWPKFCPRCWPIKRYHWKAEIISFLHVLLVWGVKLTWSLIKVRQSWGWVKKQTVDWKSGLAEKEILWYY